MIPWHASPRIAQLLPPVGPTPTPPVLCALVAEVSSLGYEEVLTGALAPPERAPYFEAGFDQVELLELLECRIDAPQARALLDVRSGTSIRRPRRSDWAAMLAVDHRAFSEFWRFDTNGLLDAVRATPSARLRVAGSEAVHGYAVTGRSGRRGYLQRLAVDPAQFGRGIGGDLLRDGLRWLRARGVEVALVNTQRGNERALALYRRHGFEPSAHDLAILGRRLVAA